MAERAALQSFLSCHLCLETFRDPVTLICSHNFCSSCLQEFWKQAENKNCPICKRSTKEDPGVNFGLKELADSFSGMKKSGSSETGKGGNQLMVCSKHQEKPKLFCKDEQRAFCTACEFSLHQGHKVTPVEQAVSELKEQLKSDLKSLQDKKKNNKQVEETYNEMIQHSKKQLVSTERQIRAEFNKLHQLLREEEESRLAALREEEEQKGKTLSRERKRIQEQISSLSVSICAVEEELQKDESFLSSYGATQSRVRAQSSLSDPQLLSGALIDVAKHLGNLSFRVWDKMKDKVHFSPVILDPNTASEDLHLSDDLTSVRDGDKKQQLPDNPERNTKYNIVFGSEGFSSGRHSWEVEVGDHPIWFVGLVKESVNRKGEYDPSPESGEWSLKRFGEDYLDVVGQTLRMKKSLQRIRVQLDYDGGQVSFYSCGDLSLICSHKDTFTEKLFPFFNIGPSLDANTSEVKICEAEILVNIM